MPDPTDAILAYHQRTKHHLHRYARSLGYLDWATQPDPFRRFPGSPRLALDRGDPPGDPPWDALFDARRPPPAPLDRAAVSTLFWRALALSAWKEAGASRWALRVNPSSGNLHPTEGYLVAPAIPGLTDAPGIHHYAPLDHALETRTRLDPLRWKALAHGLPPGGFLLGLTSISWREAWKYGERAWRYCQHDTGHALAALALAAASLGWSTRLLEAPADAALATLLRIDDQTGPEAEHPELLLLVAPGPPGAAADGWTPDPAALAGLPPAPPPAPLSPTHQAWDAIDQAIAAGAKPGPPVPGWLRPPCPPPPPAPGPDRPLTTGALVRQRRSAVAMDGRTGLPAAAFFRILARTLPGLDPPLAALPWRPAVHLVLFVHRVEGLAPGTYLLVREPGMRAALRAALAPGLEWAPVEAPVPELYRLRAGDARAVARTVSCHQDIAADGAFAVAMLAEFEARIRAEGAWMWRRLHWEAGAIGQMLYLESEAAGIRGTGIGCFFDDALHERLGIVDRSFQTLYHFTAGGPVDDPRLRTGPPYP